MDDKDDKHHEESVFRIQMIPIDENSLQQMTVVYVKVNLVEHGLGSMTCGNIKCIVLNLETLTRYNKTSRGAGGTGTNLA
jgi:hypothetical protein